ncbi:MAG: four helix bundle protein [Proteobacteria bacterium]|nr:four helix bundle protein [Pseudomonadota bacterium]
MPTHYNKLLVWQKAMKLTVVIYQITKKLPDDERYGLISQMRRAAVSIPSNIAEGHARSSSPKDFKHFLMIARGSTAELDTQLLLCVKLNLLENSDVAVITEQIEEISRMLYSFIQTLSKDPGIL